MFSLHHIYMTYDYTIYGISNYHTTYSPVMTRAALLGSIFSKDHLNLKKIYCYRLNLLRAITFPFATIQGGNYYYTFATYI